MIGPLDRKLGAHIRTVRRSGGFPLRAVADAAGVSVSYLSSVERGLNSPPLETYRRIAGALGIKLSALVRAAETEETA